MLSPTHGVESVNFGHVRQKICDLELRLKSQRDAIMCCQTLGLTRDLRKKEEILCGKKPIYAKLKTQIRSGFTPGLICEGQKIRLLV